MIIKYNCRVCGKPNEFNTSTQVIRLMESDQGNKPRKHIAHCEVCGAKNIVVENHGSNDKG